MHPLDGAYERVNGARERLDDLRPEISTFRQEVANGVTLNYQRGTVVIDGKERVVPIGTATATVNKPAPLRTTRLISEVIQHLRIALDYLVYELACHDAKSIMDKTQFVIVDSEPNFRKNKWHLNGMSGEHIAAFERLQPYNGCDWTKVLRDLSNPDKHRYLTTVRSPVTVSIDSHNTDAILAGQKVDVNEYASVQIAFSDGTPVIEGLEQLISNVAQVLRDFEPEFQR